MHCKVLRIHGSGNKVHALEIDAGSGSFPSARLRQTVCTMPRSGQSRCSAEAGRSGSALQVRSSLDCLLP